MEPPVTGKKPVETTPVQNKISGLRVLVVDDSKTARFAMKRNLEQLRNKVVTVGSAYEAYNFLGKHRPDIIFLDNIMPGISGMEALNTLQRNQKTSKIPVVFVTSIDTDEFITEALQHGAREVLHKPPTVDVLSEVLRHIHEVNFRREPRLINPETSSSTTVARNHQHASTDANSPILVQKQIDAAFKRLKDELTIKISELRSELLAFEQSNVAPQDIEAFRKVAREEAESLNREVQAEMEAITRRLDNIAMRQIQTLQQVLRIQPPGDKK